MFEATQPRKWQSRNGNSDPRGSEVLSSPAQRWVVIAPQEQEAGLWGGRAADSERLGRP